MHRWDSRATCDDLLMMLMAVITSPSCEDSSESRDMHQALQDFLCAQQVQAPVRLFSDWLFVGHIDEFLSFVPAPDRQVRSPSSWVFKPALLLCGDGKATEGAIPPPRNPMWGAEPPTDSSVSQQGFRLLMSSPRACYQLLQEQQSQGHGEVPLFEGIPSKLTMAGILCRQLLLLSMVSTVP